MYGSHLKGKYEVNSIHEEQKYSVLGRQITSVRPVSAEKCVQEKYSNCSMETSKHNDDSTKHCGVKSFVYTPSYKKLI